MCEETYEMWVFPTSKDEAVADGWFEVDEVIAPVIQELNLRGYKTTYCCSGHPASGLTPVYFTDTRTSETIDCKYLEFFQSTLYIAFVRDYGFGYDKQIPSPFYMDDENTVLRLRYKAMGGFPLLRERLEACEQLFAWARTLPIIAANRMLPSGSAA